MRRDRPLTVLGCGGKGVGWEAGERLERGRVSLQGLGGGVWIEDQKGSGARGWLSTLSQGWKGQD